jgi:SAM-dependent methyltransferase
MKLRESGMPEEAYWESLLDVPLILDRAGISGDIGDIVEFGCGYGTFTIPAARLVGGIVHALDIETEMVEHTAAKAKVAGLSNVRVERRDLLADGTGLSDASVDYAMLFNILHCEQPHLLLSEARRVLGNGGLLGIIHWNYDPSTPRGPSMDIRPRPQQCHQWAEQAGLRPHGPSCIDLPPYHYGMVYRK